MNFPYAVGGWNEWATSAGFGNANTVWLLLLALVFPLGLVAWWNRIYPHTPLAILAVAHAVNLIATLIYPDVVWAAVALDGAIILAAAADLLTLPRSGDFSAER